MILPLATSRHLRALRLVHALSLGKIHGWDLASMVCRKAAGYNPYSVDLLLAGYLAGWKEGLFPQIIL